MKNRKEKTETLFGELIPSPLEKGWGEVRKGETLNIGIVGTGSFAEFAIKCFSQIPGIKIIAVTDINKEALMQFSKTHNAIAYDNLESLLDNNSVELVYIATPPYLHYQQSKLALQAGKHVICEKPAALRLNEAVELLSMAASYQLLYVVNLMQRYNPLYHAVDTIIKEKVLGNFLHGFFENYASDETLSIDHWFWDETKSGGIFIEHGVHFFDMFSGWLGKGEVVNALQILRPGVNKNITDRVQATVMYKDGSVNFYHGFDQPKILDRQEMRLLFEHGEITLYEWVPVKMKLHGLVKDGQLEYLKEIIGGSSVIYHNKTPRGNQTATGRFTEINFDEEITLECGNITEKQNRYQQLLISMVTDQWNWIKDHNHIRIIDGCNAVESLRMAEQATNIAQKL